MYCVKCRFLVSGTYCTMCGSKTIEDQFNCPDCDQPNYVSAKFCANCGHPIQVDAQAAMGEKREGGEHSKKEVALEGEKFDTSNEL